MDTGDYPMTPPWREENYNKATCFFKFVAQWHIQLIILLKINLFFNWCM